MKYLITCTFILCLFLQLGKAEYKKLIDENKLWVMYYYSNIELDIVPEATYEFCYFKGDTSINGQLFSKLYTQTFYHSNIANVSEFGKLVNDTLQKPYLSNLLREDTTTKCVYTFLCLEWSPDSSNIEDYSKYYCSSHTSRLLYDFSKEPGDSFNIIDEWEETNQKVFIDSAKTILTPTARNVFSYTTSRKSTGKFIEGMGNIIGVDVQLGTQNWGERSHFYLVAFYENGILHYGSEDYPDYVTSTRTTINTDGFKMYPTITSQFLIIDNIKASAVIEVFSLHGKLMDKFEAKYQHKINVSKYPSGTYITKVSGININCEFKRWVKVK